VITDDNGNPVTDCASAYEELQEYGVDTDCVCPDGLKGVHLYKVEKMN